MRQEPLPEKFSKMSDEDIHSSIIAAKKTLGPTCVILGHHYQRDEVIRHADFTGDSLKLARLGREQTKARHVVFCGVHFMAETSFMLASPGQQVSLPDMEAGCDMADMADATDVKSVWDDVAKLEITNIVPITYINSSAALKAHVGEHGGAICTSSNAKKVVTWALERGKHVFFFPDQHLGRNVAKGLGLDPVQDMLLWNPAKHLGGRSEQELRSARIWLWRGHCPVHALFTVKQIDSLRREDPSVKVIVHPECAMEVVDRSDLSGSTEFIINTVAASPAGSSWAIGTEKNLVERIAAQHPDKKIVSVNPFTCLCGTMNRISARHLAWVLDDLVVGKPLRNPITVPADIAAKALKALDIMLQC